MSVSLTINGVTFDYPELEDEGWATDATGWASAVTQGMLQKAGGSFVLTADVDFGASFGLKSVYYKSRASNPSSSGIIRLGNAETIAWRNAGNSGNITMTVNASDGFEFSSHVNLLAQSELRLQDTSGGEYVALRASGTQSTYTITLPSSAPVNGNVLTYNGTNYVWTTPSGTGTVVGPGSSTDSAIVRFDGTTGQLLKNTGILIDDSNNMTAVQSIAVVGAVLISNGSAGSPSLSLNSDNDGTGTGLFRKAANSLAFSANGTEIGSYSSGGLWTFGGSGDATSIHSFNGRAVKVSGSSTSGQYFQAVNTGNTAATNEYAALFLSVGGATTIGDPYINFNILSATDWCVGVDNSSSDEFQIRAGAAPGASPYLSIQTSGTLAAGPALDFSVTARTATITCASSGNIATLLADNTSNTASSDSLLLLRVAGSSGGDPYIRYQGAGTNWAEGVDNSDSDCWKVVENSALDTTNDHLKIASGGVVTIGKSGATVTHVVNGKLQLGTIINTGTLTLPTSTDTLVGKATTDTLTNKTISYLSNTLTLPSSQYYSGYTGGSNAKWTTTTNSFGDGTNTNGNALTQRQASGLTVTAAASNAAGITFSPASASAVYKVTASFCAANTGANNCSYRLYDGSTEVVSAQTFGSSVTRVTMVGLWAPGTTSASTIKLQFATGGGTLVVDDEGSTSTGRTIEWTVERII